MQLYLGGYIINVAILLCSLGPDIMPFLNTDITVPHQSDISLLQRGRRHVSHLSAPFVAV